MFIRKSKLKYHIQKVRAAEVESQSKIWRKKIDELEKTHKQEILKLKDLHYRQIREKNAELKKSRGAWNKYKDKTVELANLTSMLKNLIQLYNLNAMDLYKYSCQIQEGMDRAERFILNNESKITKLLGTYE